jgi:hypothetical protein
MDVATPSDRQLFTSAAFLLLGRIGLWLSAIYFGVKLLISQPIPDRVWYVGGVSLAFTFIASRLSNTPSLVWQTLLQACAVAGIVIGLSILFRTLGNGGDDLLGRSGATGMLALLVGAASALALKRLQAHIKG